MHRWLCYVLHQLIIYTLVEAGDLHCIKWNGAFLLSESTQPRRFFYVIYINNCGIGGVQKLRSGSGSDRLPTSYELSDTYSCWSGSGEKGLWTGVWVGRSVRVGVGINVEVMVRMVAYNWPSCLANLFGTGTKSYIKLEWTRRMYDVFIRRRALSLP